MAHGTNESRVVRSPAAPGLHRPTAWGAIDLSARADRALTRSHSPRGNAVSDALRRLKSASRGRTEGNVPAPRSALVLIAGRAEDSLANTCHQAKITRIICLYVRI